MKPIKDTGCCSFPTKEPEFKLQVKKCENFELADSCSVIKWQTGEPKEEGMYIISINGQVKVSECIMIDIEEQNCEYIVWREFDDEDIAAWCKLSDIEPYKEE